MTGVLDKSGNLIKQLTVSEARGLIAGWECAVFVLSSLTFLAIKATIGLRVKPEEELNGLDISEHGERAYN